MIRQEANPNVRTRRSSHRSPVTVRQLLREGLLRRFQGGIAESSFEALVRAHVAHVAHVVGARGQPDPSHGTLLRNSNSFPIRQRLALTWVVATAEGAGRLCRTSGMALRISRVRRTRLFPIHAVRCPMPPDSCRRRYRGPAPWVWRASIAPAERRFCQTWLVRQADFHQKSAVGRVRPAASSDESEPGEPGCGYGFLAGALSCFFC